MTRRIAWILILIVDVGYIAWGAGAVRTSQGRGCGRRMIDGRREEVRPQSSFQARTRGHE